MIRLNIPARIETQRLLIQRLKYEDADEIFFTYASKSEATRFVSWPTHNSISDTRNYLRYAVDAWKRGLDYSFSIRLLENNRLVGSCGLIHDNGKVQYGYIFGPLHWGKGYATEVGLAMIELVRTQPLYRVSSFVDVENAASQRVLLKIGMTQQAVLEKWFRFVNQENQPKDCALFKL